MYEGVLTGTAEDGDEYVASFTQEMNLQGGEYLLSISCTGYAEGEFKVYYRLYDVISVTVVSMQDTVGFYDMFSETVVTKNGKVLEKNGRK
jgi:teichoic acid transport system ATP-binding protein